MLSLVLWLVAVSFHSPNLPFLSYLTREVGTSPHDVVVDENSLSKTKARRCKGWWFMLTCCLSVGAASHVTSHQNFVSLFFFTGLSLSTNYNPYQAMIYNIYIYILQVYPYQPTKILHGTWPLLAAHMFYMIGRSQPDLQKHFWGDPSHNFQVQVGD